MKSGIAISVVLFARVATVLSFFVLAGLAQARETEEFQVQSVRTSSEVLAKFFTACDPLSDSRCPSTPPRCGAEDFRISDTGLDTGAYRSCSALGGASPAGYGGDVAQGCACFATCEHSGKVVTGRWDCNRCLAVCE